MLFNFLTLRGVVIKLRFCNEDDAGSLVLNHNVDNICLIQLSFLIY